MKKDQIFYDNDAELDDVKPESVAVIGYGIQGRSQALNLRDSGLNVIIGNREDSYSSKVEEDGFQLYPIQEACSKATTIFLLVPRSSPFICF